MANDRNTAESDHCYWLEADKRPPTPFVSASRLYAAPLPAPGPAKCPVCNCRRLLVGETSCDWCTKDPMWSQQGVE